MQFDENIERALSVIKRLPLVTNRTAQKILFFLLKNRQTYTKELISVLERLTSIGECRICNMPTSNEICEICASPKRNNELIIVEDFADLAAIEQMGEYNGKYYLLNMRLDIKSGVGPENLNLERLIENIKEQNIRDVIFAFDQSPEMEATKLLIIEKLQPLNINMYNIAVGMPFGSELEYADKRTIRYALQNKVKI